MPSNDSPADIVVLAPGQDQLNDELARLEAAKGPRFARFVMAALSSVPWVGGLFSATASFCSESDQSKVNVLQRRWLEEHRERLKNLASAISDVTDRLEQFGDEVKDRLESEEYLSIVRKAFRAWDQADTKEKRRFVQQVLANAGSTSVTSDDVVRLFIQWIELYHEAHFSVIREVFKNRGATRADIWTAIHGQQVREDSAEADLFKLLIRDLSTGGVIRQRRETTHDGRFPKKKPAPRTGTSMMKSAFDDTEPYELTELGSQFVHYTMNEIVPRVGAGEPAERSTPGASPSGTRPSPLTGF
jgi:hypothetical protein